MVDYKYFCYCFKGFLSLKLEIIKIHYILKQEISYFNV